jgi:lipopolysaccharide/colanic/teichoic acid biosynthesis glycosyltransferase
LRKSSVVDLESIGLDVMATSAVESGIRLRPFAASLLSSRRFQLATSLLVAAALPLVIRSVVSGGVGPANINALAANASAVILAFWMRLSVETYPGIRRSYIIVPTVLAAHGIAFAALLATRLPSSRANLLLGVLLHIAWLYLLHLSVERNLRRRIAVVPSGSVDCLAGIQGIQWHWLKRPLLRDARGCDAVVADFSDLPDEWEAFLAEAALAGRIVYQRKQLSESLTGRVELQHLSENTFGSLLPSQAYFHLKGLIDFFAAVVLLPLLLPPMGLIALAIRAEDGGPAIFRQRRVGHGGRRITVYKFRTMRLVEPADPKQAAITVEDDERITKVGRTLRRFRLDELPQIFNILKWEMSWIGPRPEAEVLSAWYTEELPFYRYRHVVKPGVSGWAQVNQGHVVDLHDVDQKLQYDFYYIKYFSPWLDLLILIRTIATMLTGFGAK